MAIDSVASVLAQLPATGGLFTAARSGPAVTDRWIATDRPPYLTQHWPLLAAVPFGWHEVSAEEAATLQRFRPTVIFGPHATGDPVDDLVALSTGELATAGSADRRPGRTPRAARPPRAPRPSRQPREPRPARGARAPRPARAPRKPRPPRAPRKPRTSRRPYAKTKYDVGWCKRPACTCWTPAGCIGPQMLEAVKLAGLLGGASADCYPGPCYDYGACVTNQCFSEVSCAIRGIYLFWAKQYHVVAAYLAEQGTAAVTAVVAARQRGLARLAPPVPTPEAPGIPLGAFTTGCGPGEYWQATTIGCRCGPPGAYGPPASAELLARCGISV